MKHDIILRTIPHTGTRFVMEFLNYLGVKCQQWHIGWPTPIEYIQFDDKRVDLDNVPRTPETRYVATCRNPYHTYESIMHDGRTWDHTVHEFHTALEEFCDSGESVHILPLDTPDKQQALTDLAEFCGVEYDGGFDWHNVKPSGCQHGDCPDDAKKQLYGAYLWYKDHTPMKIHPEWKHGYDCTAAGFTIDWACDCGVPKAE